MDIISNKKEMGMKWEMVKLGDLCKFSQGIQVDVNLQSPIKNEGQIRFLRIIDFTQGNQAERYVNISNEKAFVEADDISMVRYGATGFVCTGIEGIIANNIFKIIPKNPNLNKRFLFFILNSSYIQSFIASINKGVAMPAISFGTLSDIQIPLPPLATQKRIADILDAADTLRRKDQELLKKYDELAQAIFIDMFGDPDKNPNNFGLIDLSSICIEVVDCPHSTPIHTENITNYPCIRTSEMKNGKIVWDKMKYLDYDNYLIRVKRLTPKAGDLVYAREGTYGEAVILPEGFDFALGQRTMLLRLDSEKCDNLYICHLVNSDFVYKQAKRKNMGSTVGHVNVADVKKFHILLPPLDLQRRFGNVLKIINDQISSIDKKTLAQDLFQSLLQKAFKGEL